MNKSAVQNLQGDVPCRDDAACTKLEVSQVRNMGVIKIILLSCELPAAGQQM